MPKFVEGFADKLIVPAGARDVQVFDTELPGFGVRKFKDGHASYFVKFNIGRQQRRKTLGKVVRGNLKAMRLEASTILAKARLGVDSVALARAEAAKTTITLGQLVPLYLKARENKLRPKSYNEAARYLEQAWKPLHALPVDGITRQNVVAVVDQIAASSGEVAADRARTSLSALFGWAIERGYADANPTSNIKARASSKPRDRKLSDAELAEVWNACQDDDYGRIVRLLILTGQRKSEVGNLEWTEVNTAERQIELPSVRTKNDRPHVVPLSDEAIAILDQMKQKAERECVFGRRSDAGFSGWSKAKAELDARIAKARKKAGIKKPMPAWVVHDIRRTVSTGLRERRLADPHLVELILNHVGGSRGGVAGVYDRSERIEERRQALENWSAYVVKLIPREHVDKRAPALACL